MKLPLLLAAALLLAACDTRPARDADGLPPATQTGANTGGFQLEGQPFVADTTCQHRFVLMEESHREEYKQLSQLDRRLSIEQRFALLQKWRSNHKPLAQKLTIEMNWPAPAHGQYQFLAMVFDSVAGPGLYYANTLVNTFCGTETKSFIAYNLKDEHQTTMFVTGPNAPGRIIITRFDTVAHIVSGTFEGELREVDSPATHRISKGRFDYRYSQPLRQPPRP